MKLSRLGKIFSTDAFDFRLPSSTNTIHFVDGRIDPTKNRWSGSITNSPSIDLTAGMAVSVGEIEVVDNRLKFKLLSDNTIRGAAGYGVLLAELIIVDKIISNNSQIKVDLNQSN